VSIVRDNECNMCVECVGCVRNRIFGGMFRPSICVKASGATLKFIFIFEKVLLLESLLYFLSVYV
jgi:hypothetical protein